MASAPRDRDPTFTDVEIASGSFYGDLAERTGHGENFVRDFLWTFLSDKDWSISMYKTGSFPKQMLGQWAWSSFAMLVPTAVGMACADKPADRYKMLGRLLAASVAIITWDYGQLLGLSMGQKAGRSVTEAGYFASIFTGLFEGATQTTIIAFVNELCKRYENEETVCSLEAFQAAALEVAKQLPLGATLGAIPGAVWQLVYTACFVSGSVNPIAGSLLVAAAVCGCNIGCSRAIERLQPKFEALVASQCCTFKAAADSTADLDGKGYEMMREMPDDGKAGRFDANPQGGAGDPPSPV